MGRAVFPPCCLACGQTVVEIMVTATSFKRTCSCPVVFSALTLQRATVDPHLCQRLLDTHRQVWLSLLWGYSSFLLAPGAHEVLFAPSKSLFPQSCGSFAIKSHWPPKSNSLGGFSVLLPDPQVGKSVVVPRTFLTVREFLWYNCSVVCGLSAQWLYDGVNGDLLQEGYILRC